MLLQLSPAFCTAGHIMRKHPGICTSSPGCTSPKNLLDKSSVPYRDKESGISIWFDAI